MLAGVGDGTKANFAGDKPWIGDDPSRPNEAYFKNVDAALASARKHNVNISMTLYHQRWRKIITEANARPWGKWLGQRYKDVPTIVWSMTPEAKKEFVPVLRELAGGLKEGDGGGTSSRSSRTLRPTPRASCTRRAGCPSTPCRSGRTSG